MKISKQCEVLLHDEENLAENIINLLNDANESAKKAYAPYSKFRVGAALALETGETVLGNNQENAAYPSGLCAERVAVFAAKANFPDGVISTLVITVLTDIPVKQGFTPPCGSCLQVLWDIQNRQKTPIEIFIKGADNQIYSVNNVNQFLPFGFEL